jgi:hypothetical protein
MNIVKLAGATDVVGREGLLWLDRVVLYEAVAVL